MVTPKRPTSYVEQTHLNEEKAIAAEDAGRTVVPAAPMKITFEFTADCNIHCFFCECEFIRNQFRAKGIHKFAMDETHFRAMAETAFPYVSLVTPSGVGEILTYEHFDLMLDYGERFAVQFEIFTNGMLLRGPRVERMMPLLYRLAISFDGATKETFDHIRTGAKFETVVENLRYVRDLRRDMGLQKDLRLGFSVTLMRENIEELPGIIEWAHEFEIGEVKASHLIVFTQEIRKSSLFEHKELANEWITKAKERAADLGVFLEAPELFPLSENENSIVGQDKKNSMSALASKTFALPPVESPAPTWAKEKGRLWCRFAWREVYISYEGDVSPCDHQNRPVVGNVFRDNWEDIWNGEEYQELRKGLHSGHPQSYCASCAILAEFGLVKYQEAGYMFENKYQV